MFISWSFWANARNNYGGVILPEITLLAKTQFHWVFLSKNFLKKPEKNLDLFFLLARFFLFEESKHEKNL